MLSVHLGVKWNEWRRAGNRVFDWQDISALTPQAGVRMSSYKSTVYPR